MSTNFFIKVDGQGYVNGRSMEFGGDLKSRLFFRKAGHQFGPREFANTELNVSFGPYQHEWTGKYNVIGMNTHGLPMLTDGMNEAGLATGDLWLPGSEYQDVDNPEIGIPIDQFAMWMLSSFDNVDDIAEVIRMGKIQVGAPLFVQDLVPLHFPVHDAQGRSIVIEFIGGEAIVHDNPVGTLTNQPTFP